MYNVNNTGSKKGHIMK